MTPPSPEVFFCLDHPRFESTTETTLVAGWVASASPVDFVKVLRPDGRRSDALPLVERADIRRRHPGLAHVWGFMARLPAEWAADNEIQIVYACGGVEHRYSRELPYGVDLDAKAKKLTRIAPLLRLDLPGKLNAYQFDFLTPALRENYDLIEVDAVSSNHYDGVALELIRKHADGLILDAGAGSRQDYLPNVVNFEIVPYPSTDVLGVGEELPFLDNSFDAVFSLAVLEHVKDPFQCARELARVLKPGGTLYAAVPFLQPYHGYPHHYYNMTHQGLANLFAGTLEVKEQRVLASGHPIWTLSWFLQAYCAGLPAGEREKFQQMKIADFLGEPVSLLKKDYVTALNEEANFKLASATMLLATKPSA